MTDANFSKFMAIVNSIHAGADPRDYLLKQIEEYKLEVATIRATLSLGLLSKVQAQALKEQERIILNRIEGKKFWIGVHENEE